MEYISVYNSDILNLQEMRTPVGNIHVQQNPMAIEEPSARSKQPIFLPQTPAQTTKPAQSKVHVHMYYKTSTTGRHVLRNTKIHTVPTMRTTYTLLFNIYIYTRLPSSHLPHFGNPRSDELY